MRKLFYIESILATILAGLLLLLIQPFSITVPQEVYEYILLAAVCVHFCKVIVIWRAAPQDERELQHRFHSSWIAYLSVSTVLIAGIATQGLTTHTVDPWLPLALATLFLSKVTTRLYLEVTH